MILAIDPGRDKTGIALYDPITSAVLYHGIVTTSKLVEFILDLDRGRVLEKKVEAPQGITLFLLGNGTHSKAVATCLEEAFTGRKFELIDEFNSTMEARSFYFELHPPKGLKRLIPRSMQVPPRPVDDLVAVILLKRYLGQLPKFSLEK